MRNSGKTAPSDDAGAPGAPGDGDPDGDLSDMLGELRVLLPSAQLLTAFLITVPFNTGFGKIVAYEKWLFMATFAFAVSSLVMFSAPAVQHRLLRPLRDRSAFKRIASRQTLAGCFALSLALVLGTDLVLSEVLGHWAGIIAASTLALLVGVLWWSLPLVLRARGRF